MSGELVWSPETSLRPDNSRVIIRPFVPDSEARTKSVIARILARGESEMDGDLAALREEFAPRHLGIEAAWRANFERIRRYLPARSTMTPSAELLLGAVFSAEYALESAALFNPSIVPHPDQNGLEEGSLRFLMSLRATGEGHVSSIEFRSGVVTRSSGLRMDPLSRFTSATEGLPDPDYGKTVFGTKLREMGFDNEFGGAVLAGLGETFRRSELDAALAALRRAAPTPTRELYRSLEAIRWLADSNYELRFPAGLALSERVIFPVSPRESRGIEDARFVRFAESDGSTRYYATYTACDGRAILSQLIETGDFLGFRMSSLVGDGVRNKGLALFPRRIGGRYAMLGRQDDENISIMFSDDLHFWRGPRPLLGPAELWESVKVGNCGSPIETEAGWLIFTHGVGPMRKYCIGAALLDLEDPTRVLGRLRSPLVSPEGPEREGYVPNVVYSCGALLFGREILLPVAVSDTATHIGRLSLDGLLAALRR